MLWAVALSATAIGAGIYVWQGQQQPERIIAPSVSPVAKTVTALGRLEPKGKVIMLSGPSDGGRLEQLLVQAGDTVKAGQTLAILDSRAQRAAAVAEAQQKVAVAQADLDKVRAGAQQGEIGAQDAEVLRLTVERQTQMVAQEAEIRRLEATRGGEIAVQEAAIARLQAEQRNAEAEARRYEALFGAGAIAASQRDSVRLTAEASRKQVQEAQASLARIRTARQAEIDVAQATLNQIQSGQAAQIRSANATLDRITEVRPVDVQAAVAQLKAAQASLKKAEADLAQAWVKAPQAGTVIEILARPGESVGGSSGESGIVRLGQTWEMVAIAEIYESDIQAIQPGQPVRLTSPSLPNELKGTVDRVGLEIKRQEVVNTDPAANIDARVVEVEIQLDAVSRQQVAGFTNLQVTTQIQMEQPMSNP